MKKNILLLSFILFLYIYFSFLFTFITCFPNVVIYMALFLIPFFSLGFSVLRRAPRFGISISFVSILWNVNIWYLLYTTIIFPLLAWIEVADDFLEGGNCVARQGLFINSFIPIYFAFVLAPSLILFFLFFGIRKLVNKPRISLATIVRASILNNVYTVSKIMQRKVSIFIFALCLGLLLPPVLQGVYDHIKFDVAGSVYDKAFKNEGLSASTFYFTDLWGDYYYTDAVHFRREIIPGSGVYYFDTLYPEPAYNEPISLYGARSAITIYPAFCDQTTYFSDYYTNGSEVYYKNRWLRQANPTQFSIVCGEMSIMYPAGQTYSYWYPFGKSQDKVYYKGKEVPGLSPAGFEYTSDGIWHDIHGKYRFYFNFNSEDESSIDVLPVL